MSVTFKGTAIKCGDRHGWVHQDTPAIYVQRQYFWGTNNENHLIGGRGGRAIHVRCILNDDDFNTIGDIDDYLRELDTQVADYGELEVIAAGSTRTHEECYLTAVERVNQPGQNFPIPLYDSSGLVGDPDHWWIEVVLHFMEAQIDAPIV